MSHRNAAMRGRRRSRPHRTQRTRRRRARRRRTGPVATAVVLGLVLALAGTSGFFLVRDAGHNLLRGVPGGAPGGATDGSGGTGGSDGEAGPGADGRRPRKNGAKPPAPSLYTDVESPGAFRPIVDRSADPQPLTIDEVFTANTRALSYRGVRLSLLDSRIDGSCRPAVWGEPLRRDLRLNGCSQVARGVYADAEREIVGMVAIFNMKDVEGATAIIEALDPEHGGGFIRPPRDVPPSGRLGRGYSEAYAHAMGHFVFVRWAGRVDEATSGPDSSGVSDASVALTEAQWAIRQRVLGGSSRP